MKKKSIILILIVLFVTCLKSCDTFSDSAGSSDCPASRRTGAVCNDGTSSSATGSGACSSHGDVDHWLCR